MPQARPFTIPAHEGFFQQNQYVTIFKRTDRDPIPLPPRALANSSPQKLLALIPYVRLISRRRHFEEAPIKVLSWP
ncbi:unnamed protein product [Colias eurytheme]|nr:unnamed protein product [Colias eurytheme]